MLDYLVVFEANGSFLGWCQSNLLKTQQNGLRILFEIKSMKNVRKKKHSRIKMIFQITIPLKLHCLFVCLISFIWFCLHVLLCTICVPGVQDGDKPLCWCWESNPDPLQQQKVLLTIEPTIQSWSYTFLMKIHLSLKLSFHPLYWPNAQWSSTEPS